ncbi:Stress response protein nst1 [Holothuria leucospilota]|uniref:Stress response protein nst1 n=1 Tax=Holothuria leucospilota TaxID=206669 RepID=A0A9Q1BH23_HOLLE|nr:Stress response protein nst1 [Holothuria leucospilota]
MGMDEREVTMLLVNFIQWCSLLILLESPYLLRADDKNRTRFNINRKLEDNYVELQNIYTSVEEFTSLYAPDDKRLEGLEVMTDYLMVECGETFIQMDDGKACLDAIISVVQHMPDFDVNNLSCGDDYQNCSWFHGNETKEKIETFRYALLNGKQNTQVSTGRHEVSVNDGNTEDCPPDALFWQGLEDWSSNLTSMLRRLKAESHDELEQTCRDHITLFRERKKRKREQSKERKKRKRQQRRERKKSKRERQRQKRRKMKERKKKQKEKEKRKEERQVKKAAKEEKRQHRQSKGK